MLDTKIVNARVIDGSGRAADSADVGILGGKIAAIGDLRETAAGEYIDAWGRVLTPGFLDIHRHADLAIPGRGRTARRSAAISPPSPGTPGSCASPRWGSTSGSAPPCPSTPGNSSAWGHCGRTPRASAPAP